MITAQCHICKKQIEVPSTWAMNYIMIHEIPCRTCFHKVEEE